MVLKERQRGMSAQEIDHCPTDISFDGKQANGPTFQRKLKSTSTLKKYQKLFTLEHPQSTSSMKKAREPFTLNVNSYAPSKLRGEFIHSMSRKVPKGRMNSLHAAPNLSLMGPMSTGIRGMTGDYDVLGSPSTLIGLRDPPGGMLASRLSAKSDFGQKTVSDNRFMIRNGKQPVLAKSTTAVREDALVPRLRYFNNFV
jgi:hypothetical protein